MRARIFFSVMIAHLTIISLVALWPNSSSVPQKNKTSPIIVRQTIRLIDSPPTEPQVLNPQIQRVRFWRQASLPTPQIPPPKVPKVLPKKTLKRKAPPAQKKKLPIEKPQIVPKAKAPPKIKLPPLPEVQDYQIVLPPEEEPPLPEPPSRPNTGSILDAMASNSAPLQEESSLDWELHWDSGPRRLISLPQMNFPHQALQDLEEQSVEIIFQVDSHGRVVSTSFAGEQLKAYNWQINSYLLDKVRQFVFENHKQWLSKGSVIFHFVQSGKTQASPRLMKEDTETDRNTKGINQKTTEYKETGITQKNTDYTEQKTTEQEKNSITQENTDDVEQKTAEHRGTSITQESTDETEQKTTEQEKTSRAQENTDDAEQKTAEQEKTNRTADIEQQENRAQIVEESWIKEGDLEQAEF